jgi:acid stress chaperone HdeB
MKLMTAIGAGALASVSIAAQAQVTLDVSKISCDQFVGYKIADPRNIAIWLSGYYNGKRGNTVIDPQRLNENARKLQDYCLDHPQVPVMRAVEAAFRLEK